MSEELFVRPTYKAWGVYKSIGINRATVVFEGTKEECYKYIEEKRYNNG